MYKYTPCRLCLRALNSLALTLTLTRQEAPFISPFHACRMCSAAALYVFLRKVNSQASAALISSSKRRTEFCNVSDAAKVGLRGQTFVLAAAFARSSDTLGTMHSSADGALTCRGLDTAERSSPTSNGGCACKGKQAQQQ